MNFVAIRCHVLQGCPSRSLMVLLLRPQVVEVKILVLLEIGVDRQVHGRRGCGISLKLPDEKSLRLMLYGMVR